MRRGSLLLGKQEGGMTYLMAKKQVQAGAAFPASEGTHEVFSWLLLELWTRLGRGAVKMSWGRATRAATCPRASESAHVQVMNMG